MITSYSSETNTVTIDGHVISMALYKEIQGFMVDVATAVVAEFSPTNENTVTEWHEVLEQNTLSHESLAAVSVDVDGKLLSSWNYSAESYLERRGRLRFHGAARKWTRKRQRTWLFDRRAARTWKAINHRATFTIDNPAAVR